MKRQSLIVKVDNLKDLLIPPTQDPLSNYDYIQNGEAALPHAIRYINPKEYKNISNINIYLSSKTQESNIDIARRFVHHYLNFQIKEDTKKMIVFKYNTIRIFRNAILFLMICMAIVTLIGMESFLPHLPPLMRSVLVEGFTVMGWVIMWRPFELIINQWTALKMEIQLYQTLLTANIQIQSFNDV